MALKILCFGEKDFLSSTIAAIRPEPRTITDEEILVDSIEVNSKSFLVFSIKNSELISSQSTGTDGNFFLI